MIDTQRWAMSSRFDLTATCTHCGTGWALSDDQPTCPDCGATSYTVPRDDAWAYSLQQEFEQAESAGSWDV